MDILTWKAILSIFLGVLSLVGIATGYGAWKAGIRHKDETLAKEIQTLRMELTALEQKLKHLEGRVVDDRGDIRLVDHRACHSHRVDVEQKLTGVKQDVVAEVTGIKELIEGGFRMMSTERTELSLEIRKMREAFTQLQSQYEVIADRQKRNG